ncbi:hypothetical protein J2T08_002497 [Neorhizobium galegae]|nr:hypothetical protein [Neorhizobium galegae]
MTAVPEGLSRPRFLFPTASPTTPIQYGETLAQVAAEQSQLTLGTIQ